MRLYSNIAQDTVLTADPGVSGATLNVVSTTGWPSPSSGDTALVCLDFGASNVELVEYTGMTGTSFTGCVRAVDGTAAGAHNVGAGVRHVASASDIQAFMRWGEISNAALLAATRYGPNGVTSLTTQSATSGTLREVQWLVPSRTHFVEIGMEVTVAGAGNLRFVVYRDSGSAKPSTLVLDCGVVSASTTGYKPVTIDVWLARGLYHLAVMPEGATVTYRACNSHNPPARIPAAATTGTTIVTGYQANSVTTGAAPNPFPSTVVLTNAMPFILLLTA